MPDHERHFLCCHVLRCDDEIALIFTVCGIQDDDEFALLESSDGILYAVEAQLGDAIGCHLGSDQRQGFGNERFNS